MLLMVGCAVRGGSASAADTPKELPPQPQPPYLTPEQEAKTFQLPPGYSMQLVLSDPDIKEPVVCVFDGNGRMYVSEMRSYMQDIDGNNELVPVGRVSRHESSKGDGVFDKHTVFADHLLLPRMVLPLPGRVLINETNTNDILAYHDTNGDGVAVKKEIFYEGGPRGGNLEHQQSGLVWGLDNWMYQAVNGIRLRFDGKQLLKETTPGNGGQWGLAQDNYGKMWFSNGGAEKGPVRFQMPIIYGAVDTPDEESPDFLEVWPLVGLADVQGGTSRYRPEDKTLNHFTATCGQTIFRGDRLPLDLRGDFLIGEPVGRLIRRAKVENHDGLTYLKNAYDHNEFLRSTDPYFRPVNMTTGPDGCLYIVDMYRGIIQEGNWVREGSYLRTVVKQYGLQNNVGHGRIWRLVHKDFTPGPQPHLLDETPAQLVTYLDHPNGWWRDTAQMLLVLKQDKSVVPALVQLVRQSKEPLGRLHALWTLEGLDALDPALVREQLKDADPNMRIAAIRVSESLYKKGDKSWGADVGAMARDPDPSVVLQTLETGKLLNWPEYSKFAQLTLAATSAHGVKEIGAMLLNTGHEIDEHKFTKPEVAVLRKGEAIYQELCYACHGYAGTGMPLDNAPPGSTIGPPLAGSREVLDHPDTVVHILLNGLTGPVSGKGYVAQMVPMDSNNDEWIAAIGSYVRNSFGNRGTMIAPADVARLRGEARGRKTPWSVDELHTLYPRPVGNPKDWKLTASHNSTDAKLAADGNFDSRWTSKQDLAPGMWIQVELPQEAKIGGLWVDGVKSSGDYARAFKVEVSADGISWGKPVAQGKGSAGVMEIKFSPVTAKFVRLTQTGSLKSGERNLYWSIHELQVLEPVPEK
jgi:mono/diheme cytochrome c family protein/glucose/arabinose dehydrogenase